MNSVSMPRFSGYLTGPMPDLVEIAYQHVKETGEEVGIYKKAGTQHTRGWTGEDLDALKRDPSVEGMVILKRFDRQA